MVCGCVALLCRGVAEQILNRHAARGAVAVRVVAARTRGAGGCRATPAVLCPISVSLICRGLGTGEGEGLGRCRTRLVVAVAGTIGRGGQGALGFCEQDRVAGGSHV